MPHFLNPSKITKAVLVSLMLLAHALLAATSLVRESATFDEAIHMTAGYGYWTRGDYRLQPENGNLPQRWVALPLLFSRPAFPDTQRNVWEMAHSFFYKSGNDAQAMLFQGRSMTVCLSLLLALSVYFWSARLFGPMGGLISLGLYCLSPTMLAHGRLTTSDVSATLFFILSVRALWAVLHRVSLSSILGAALSVAGLVLSKMSAVLIFPVAVLLIGVKLTWGAGRPVQIGNAREIATRRGQAGVFAAVALVVLMAGVIAVWGGYGFRFSAAPVSHADRSLSFSQWDRQLGETGPMAPVLTAMRDAKMLPEAYLYGFAFTIAQSRARAAFLCGNYSDTGWWYFFPFCIAVKTPLTTLLVVALGLLAFARAGSAVLWYAACPLFCFSAVYGIAALTANLNIGHRHILPIYPVMFILAGASMLWLRDHRRATALLAPLVVVVFMVETLLIWPHYLAFFNAAAGGPLQGYRRLVDSSLDWGQDLPGLAHWIDQRRREGNDLRPVYLAYFGTASPIYYRIPAKIFPDYRLPWAKDITEYADMLGPGYYCISATTLQQVYGIHRKWDAHTEAAYRFSRDVSLQYAAVQHDAQERERFFEMFQSREQVMAILKQFADLRLARLCNHLKRRPPDDNIGYSILIYRVTSEELKTALLAPLAEPAAPGPVGSGLPQGGAAGY